MTISDLDHAGDEYAEECKLYSQRIADGDRLLSLDDAELARLGLLRSRVEELRALAVECLNVVKTRGSSTREYLVRSAREHEIECAVERARRETESRTTGLWLGGSIAVFGLLLMAMGEYGAIVLAGFGAFFWYYVYSGESSQ